MGRVLGFVMAALLAAAWSPALAQQAVNYDSFEDGVVPDQWVPSRAGALSISDLHYKHGTSSLRWDLQAADTIRVEADLGDTNRYGGYGGTYSKATFGLWVYCRQPLAGLQERIERLEIEHSQKKQRRCRLHVSRSAHWRAIANPDGRVFLELLENALNEVEVVIARVAQRISLMPSHIVAI